MTGDGNFITIAKVQADFPLSARISSSSYPTTAIATNIQESEGITEAKLSPLGYSRSDLQQAPLVASLVLIYCRYAVIRDIFAGISPSDGENAWEKWLEMFDSRIKDLTDPEKPMAQLVDANGAVIVKSNTDKRFDPTFNTSGVSRIITMDKPETWSIDKSNSDPAVIGADNNPISDPAVESGDQT